MKIISSGGQKTRLPDLLFQIIWKDDPVTIAACLPNEHDGTTQPNGSESLFFAFSTSHRGLQKNIYLRPTYQRNVWNNQNEWDTSDVNLQTKWALNVQLPHSHQCWSHSSLSHVPLKNSLSNFFFYLWKASAHISKNEKISISGQWCKPYKTKACTTISNITLKKTRCRIKWQWKLSQRSEYLAYYDQLE